MTDQGSRDIAQMNQATQGVPVGEGKKKGRSLFCIVLGCVVVGVGMGIFVYQQSVQPAKKTASASPKPSVKTVVASPAPIKSPTTVVLSSPVASASAVVPQVNLVDPYSGDELDDELDYADSSATASAVASASARATIPDTSEGVPVTGVFEVTIGTVSVGLILLVLGLAGLLAL